MFIYLTNTNTTIAHSLCTCLSTHILCICHWYMTLVECISHGLWKFWEMNLICLRMKLHSFVNFIHYNSMCLNKRAYWNHELPKNNQWWGCSSITIQLGIWIGTWMVTDKNWKNRWWWMSIIIIIIICTSSVVIVSRGHWDKENGKCKLTLADM